MPSQKYFNWLFSCYSFGYGLVSRQFLEARKKQYSKLFELQDKQKTNLLLIGGGDGLDLCFIPENVNVTYVDASEKMFSSAKKQFGNRTNIEFIHADFLGLEMVQSYDLICVHFMLSVTPRPKAILEKAINCLALGGLISVMDIYKPISSHWNLFTKFTMFNLNTDIIKLNKMLNPPMRMVWQSNIKKFRIFGSFIFEKTI